VREYLELLWTFMLIGASVFGGGYAMLPVIERELIQKRGWVDMDEVMDYYTIAQITPGIIAVNVATFVGYKRKGVAGGIITTLGIILPGMTLVVLISLCLRRFADYPLVRHAFAGIRVAVGALILDTVLKLLKGVFKAYKTAIICAAAFALSAVWSLSPVWIVLGAGLAGFLLFPAGFAARKPATSKKDGQ
jgi:chromate transporter